MKKAININEIEVFDTVCITPHDLQMKLRTDCNYILNEFRKRGFESFRAFVGVVQDHDLYYTDYHKAKELEYFWQSRRFNADTNERLNRVLEKIKAE